ncbi:MAG: hypothetical protein M1816_002917 [Peltula sp. TS41687]|nr:MAG: hypothetical protein M1816_002917 [Peltula sp. TS41687]
MKQLRGLLSGNPWLRSFHVRSVRQSISDRTLSVPSRALCRSSRSQGLQKNQLSCGFRLPSRSPTFLRRALFRYRTFAGRPDPPVGPTNAAAENSLSLSQRMRKLSREYGWSALGVYVLLSVLDFPLFFLAVRTLGAEKIGHWEHVVVEWIREVVPWELPQRKKSESLSVDDQLVSQEGVDGGLTAKETDENGEKRIAAANASIWTELALAYAVHKSFIFFRVPLTAAITPRVVKILRRWGWDLGKRKSKIPKPPKDV